MPETINTVEWGRPIKVDSRYLQVPVGATVPFIRLGATLSYDKESNFGGKTETSLRYACYVVVWNPETESWESKIWEFGVRMAQQLQTLMAEVGAESLCLAITRDANGSKLFATKNSADVPKGAGKFFKDLRTDLATELFGATVAAEATVDYDPYADKR